MLNKILTIFTPTYNKVYSLPSLYQSLLRQNDKRFLWMVLDDGSIDSTHELEVSALSGMPLVDKEMLLRACPLPVRKKFMPWVN